eukprot:Sdes_comp20858_c0_seq5m17689
MSSPLKKAKLEKSANSSLVNACNSVFEEAVKLRKYLHENPETGFKEFNTQKVLIEKFSSLGIATVRKCAGTGLVIDIVGTGPENPNYEKRCVAYRSDMDALPMQEENHHLPHRSKNDGCAHMCGHDGHMASLFAAAKIIHQQREKLPQNFQLRLLYQPAEEGPGGAKPMIEEGCLEGVDEVYGFHTWPGQLNTVSVKAGPLMAHVAEFSILVSGRGGHASQPQANIDAVLCAAHLVIALNSILSRNVHYSEQAVLTVSTIHGGEVHNVQPDKVTLSGTIRDFSPQVYDVIVKRMKQIIEHLPSAFGCSATLNLSSMYPVLVNGLKETEIVKKVAKDLLGETHVNENNLPMTGAEDMAFFLQERPGFFF